MGSFGDTQQETAKNGGGPTRSAAIPVFPVYLFDVDGTLVDSAADICGAIQTVLSKTTRPDVEQSYLQQYIGYHLVDLSTTCFRRCRMTRWTASSANTGRCIQAATMN